MTTPTFDCKFCKKSFKRESTILAHKCPKKQRYADRNTVGARLGLFAYNLFLKTCVQQKQETHETFINSQYYTDFVKFGRSLSSLKPISTEAYITWLVDTKVALRLWSNGKTYSKFMIHFLENEPTARSLERSVMTMSAWAEKNEMNFVDYFEHVTTFEATADIQNGHITPWVLYLSSNSDALLSRMSNEQILIIQAVISPAEWQLIFTKRPADVEFCTRILTGSGL